MPDAGAPGGPASLKSPISTNDKLSPKDYHQWVIHKANVVFYDWFQDSSDEKGMGSPKDNLQPIAKQIVIP
jgi:hypothetical protein